MPNTSALQFAEAGHHTQMRAFAGEVLYTEGMPADHLYVVKEGEVDLYLLRDEKRVVVETLGVGQCFGINPHQAKGRRLHNAAARSYCELYVIDQPTVATHIDGSSDLVGSLLHTLSERLSFTHELIATRVNYQPDLLIYGQLLYLLGIAEVGKAAVHSRVDHGKSPVLASPLLQDVVTQARLMFGHSDRHISGCLTKLLNLHLIRIDDEKGTGKRVHFVPKDFVSQVRKVTSQQVDNDKLSYEYISVDEFAAVVDVDRALLLRKLAGGEFADDVFTLRKAEIMRLLNDKGRRYFTERKIKRPEEFSDILDLEFADAKSVFQAVSKVDSYDLAKLVSTLDSELVKQKIVSSLSRSRREELESDLKDMRPTDPVEVQQIGNALINEVKSLMTTPRA
ncbi:cyclic nucleotide-binding domain-containing protein [Ideonella oryzae]|uniref:Crp/Fnr family transcriptional regulator n=1 Tax=Ideonella oryzae TaxID=2937441 RepID=A0ABT1BRA2_9BURK|nr:Crp/Fnr family transcriptional regulator [Ideonella oryzae]MCO5978744.1 Crp/Fnr family transcriptional regulator [Ideonella oryzae]